jgi:hypothetical protein
MDENVTFRDENVTFFGVMDEKVTLWMKWPKLWKIKNTSLPLRSAALSGDARPSAVKATEFERQ